MSQAEVQALFGSPNETKGTVCGTATGKPWDCIFWIYTYSVMPTLRLQLIYTKVGDAWLLNSWEWVRY